MAALEDMFSNLTVVNSTDVCDFLNLVHSTQIDVWAIIVAKYMNHGNCGLTLVYNSFLNVISIVLPGERNYMIEGMFKLLMSKSGFNANSVQYTENCIYHEFKVCLGRCDGSYLCFDSIKIALSTVLRCKTNDDYNMTVMQLFDGIDEENSRDNVTAYYFTNHLKMRFVFICCYEQKLIIINTHNKDNYCLCISDNGDVGFDCDGCYAGGYIGRYKSNGNWTNSIDCIEMDVLDDGTFSTQDLTLDVYKIHLSLARIIN